MTNSYEQSNIYWCFCYKNILWLVFNKGFIYQIISKLKKIDFVMIDIWNKDYTNFFKFKFFIGSSKYPFVKNEFMLNDYLKLVQIAEFLLEQKLQKIKVNVHFLLSKLN